MPIFRDATPAVLAIGLIFGVGVVCAVFLLRRVQKRQQETLGDAVRSLDRLLKVESQLISSVRHLESYRQGLQKIAFQIETAVGELKETLSTSAAATEKTHAAAIESLRDHISETLSGLAPVRQKSGESQTESGLSRWRRDVLSQDPALRFSLLWEWCSVNSLGILHRVSRGWNNANDLIANIPAYLEPEAEVLNDSVLVIGTQRHPEKLAIPFRTLEAPSDFQLWFESPPENPAAAYTPALVMRSNGHFKLLAKGATSASVTR